MNVDVPLLHHDAVDHRPQETLAVFEAERGERLADASGKGLDAEFEFGALEGRGVLTAGQLKTGTHMLAAVSQ
jgi:hypothetical protein